MCSSAADSGSVTVAAVIIIIIRVYSYKLLLYLQKHTYKKASANLAHLPDRITRLLIKQSLNYFYLLMPSNYWLLILITDWISWLGEPVGTLDPALVRPSVRQSVSSPPASPLTHTQTHTFVPFWELSFSQCISQLLSPAWRTSHSNGPYFASKIHMKKRTHPHTQEVV